MKNRTVSLALALLTALMPALTVLPEGIRGAAAVCAAEDIQLTAVEVELPAYPRAGETPDPDGCTVSAGSLEGVRWIDMAEKRELTASDPFKEGHVCSFSAYISAPWDAVWASTPDGRPSVKVTCRAGEKTAEALSVMFNQNPDGSVTLLAVFTFAVAAAEEETPAGTGEDKPEEGTVTENPSENLAESQEEGNTVSSVTVSSAAAGVCAASLSLPPSANTAYIPAARARASISANSFFMLIISFFCVFPSGHPHDTAPN